MINNSHPNRHQVELKGKQKISLCRCWRSKNFPYCDGTHRKYNPDNLGPIIVEVTD